MREKWQNYRQQLQFYAQNLRDVQTIGVLLFLLVVLLVSWSGVKAIDTNYALQKQISQLDQQVQVQRLTNNNLRLQNEYFNTPQYLELTARQNFGLGAPGETELLVPQNVALAHTITLPDAEQTETAKTKAKQPAYQRNFQAWMNFFLHRQTVSD